MPLCGTPPEVRQSLLVFAAACRFCASKKAGNWGGAEFRIVGLYARADVARDAVGG